MESLLLRSTSDVTRGQRPGLYDFQGPFDVEDHVGSSEAKAEAGEEIEWSKGTGQCYRAHNPP